MMRALLAGLALAMLTAGALSADTVPAETAPDGFDGLAWTVVRTLPDQRAPLPELRRFDNVFTGTVRPLPDRPIPPVFWFEGGGVRYGVVRQERPAPLVVLIAGTGAAFDTQSNRELAQAISASGMHVLGLPSPTHPNFIVNASSSGVPGRPQDDAADLYRVMQLALEQVRARIEVTEVHLAGFSLGALNAAWVAALDAEERAIGFDRVLLLNPPVSLWQSTQILDAMFERRVPPTSEGQRELIDQFFAQFARVFSREADTSLDGDFLYAAYRQLKPSDAALETLIALTFRIAALNLIFASDIVSDAGYVVPADAELQPTTSVSPFLGHLLGKTFLDYLEGIYLPYFKAREPGFTKEQAIAEASLKPLEAWLRDSPRIGMLTNRDEIILAPGELAWLEEVFGPRAMVFDTGGHAGNYQRPNVVAAIGRFFGSGR